MALRAARFCLPPPGHFLMENHGKSLRRSYMPHLLNKNTYFVLIVYAARSDVRFFISSVCCAMTSVCRAVSAVSSPILSSRIVCLSLLMPPLPFLLPNKNPRTAMAAIPTIATTKYVIIKIELSSVYINKHIVIMNQWLNIVLAYQPACVFRTICHTSNSNVPASAITDIHDVVFLEIPFY